MLWYLHAAFFPIDILKPSMSDKPNIAELIASHKPGWALDQRFYTDPDIYQLELDPKRRDRLQEPMLQRMAACGMKDIEIDFIDTWSKPGEQGYGYSRTALFEGYKTGSRNGEPLAPLLGKLNDYDGGASDFVKAA